LKSAGFARSPCAFGVAGLDGRLLGGDFAKRKVCGFMALVGLAGPLLKRCVEYSGFRDLRIQDLKDLGMWRSCA
jgi:hypothetical protein